MTNVLLECYSSIPSYSLTVLNFLRYKKLYPINVRAKLTRNINANDIAWCDILVCIRGYNLLSSYIAQQAVRYGRKVYLTLDDDLLGCNLSKYKLINKHNNDALTYILNKADAIITISTYLGDKYAKFARYVVVNTVIEESELKIPKILSITTNKINIVYPAGNSHYIFFNKYIAPITKKLYDKYKENISFTIIGPKVLFQTNKIDVKEYSSMPIDAYREFMSNHHFDIGLAPLFDSEFCKSKYFNKYLEYSKYGILGVYSNILPYNDVVKNGYNGLLAEDNCDSWYNAICLAIDDYKLRSNCILNSQNHLRMNFNNEVISSKLFNNLPDLLSFKAPYISLNFTNMRPMYIWFLIYEFLHRVLLRLYYKIK